MLKYKYLLLSIPWCKFVKIFVSLINDMNGIYYFKPCISQCFHRHITNQHAEHVLKRAHSEKSRTFQNAQVDIFGLACSWFKSKVNGRKSNNNNTNNKNRKDYTIFIIVIGSFLIRFEEINCIVPETLIQAYYASETTNTRCRSLLTKLSGLTIA